MQTVTLLVSPKSANLDPSLVESLRNAWGGGAVLWLSPDEAAEFTVPETPGNFWDVWRDLQPLGVDLVCQPSAGRKKRVLLADMDSTMIGQECIDELANEAGVGARVADITARAMNGELDFEASVLERVKLLKGLNKAVIETILTERIELADGARALVATMRSAGSHTVLVSGGFTQFTERVAGLLGFDEHHANTLLVERDALTGDVARPILGRAAKVAVLEEIAARLGISDADILAVGDGANDLGMIGRAGMGVALHAKPAVASRSDIRINHADLTGLLYLQGYSKDEFAGG